MVALQPFYLFSKVYIDYDKGLVAYARLPKPTPNALKMTKYETARQENIRRNKALLAELDLSIDAKSTDQPTKTRSPPAKRRKVVLSETVPSRSSARLAASGRTRPTYNEDAAVVRNPSSRPSEPRAKRYQTKGLPRTSPTRTRSGSMERDMDEIGFMLTPEIASIIMGWSEWSPEAQAPSRDSEGTFHFADQPTFTPNKSPAEVLREGAFGGTYYRPIRPRKMGILIDTDWKELPAEWIEGLDVDRFLTSSSYSSEVNKYKVACGQTIEEWEAAGWIAHNFDVRGWFQWYTRFYQGRRCADDDRQISRWRKCVGETGRWRRTLLKKYGQLGVRTVFDDGEDEMTPEVSPVIHQTCHHWAFEIRQEILDAYWASGK